MGYTLVINPGSTSTKVGVFRGKQPVLSETIRHTQEELSRYAHISKKKAFRTSVILDLLNSKGYGISDCTGVIAIGGLIRPGDAGVYTVNAGMLADLTEGRYNEHAANLGALIADDIAQMANLEAAYIADPITADELQPVARLSGMPEITRLGRAHTLNQKSVARTAANDLGIAYEQAHLVVAHLGGGISIAAHRNGRMVDTNAARGEGPFCIDRTGGLNAFELAKLCYSGKYSKEEMLHKINGGGGVVAYLSTRDFRDVEQQCEAGNQKAQEVFDSMAYQIAKEISAMTVPLQGHVDAIVLTGGMANSKKLAGEVEKQVSYLGRVLCYPGEQELEALAAYVDGIQNGQIQPMAYEQEKK